MDMNHYSILFYGYEPLPIYSNDEDYNILYYNPIHSTEERMYLNIAKLGISSEQVLRIRVHGRKSIFKIYL
jgi:hypothetical protein